MNCLFPQIQECPHRHYSNVQLNSLIIESIDEKSRDFYFLRIQSQSSQWTIMRSELEFQRLDSLIHTCLISRHFSGLGPPEAPKQYCKRLNDILSELICGLKCVLILNWFECDYKGFHLISPKESEVNRRAIGAAFVVREFNSEKSDHLSLAIGDIVSVLDSNDFWIKGKKGIQVGFFPSNCIQIINSEEIPKHLLKKQNSLKSKTFFHFFHKNQENSQKFSQKLSEILSKRVFGRDISEHLFDCKQDIPPVVTICSKFIELNGIVDGIYRLSGISSNINRIRDQFDCGEYPVLSEDPLVLADIHCVSSLLKLYLRLLPNPLLTFEFYDKFVFFIRETNESKKFNSIKSLVHRLPPPHFRTLKALIKHLRKVSEFSSKTGMTEKNLSIVWAPNLLRSRDIENRSVGGDLAALQVIGIQAVLTEYLIQKCSLIFDDNLFMEETTDDNLFIEQTTDDNPLIQITTLDIRKGSFGRQRRTKSQTKESLIRWKSFESFFTKGDNFFHNFRLNFAKIQTIIDLIQVLPKFDPKLSSFISTTIWTTTPTLKCVPIVTTNVTTSECVVISKREVRNDAIVVKQNSVLSRERIERIKAERRQQIRQNFFSNLKPIPIPRTKITPKVTPIPTPRRRSEQTEEAIRILTTSAHKKRHNWNSDAIHELFLK